MQTVCRGVQKRDYCRVLNVQPCTSLWFAGMSFKRCGYPPAFGTLSKESSWFVLIASVNESTAVQTAPVLTLLHPHLYICIVLCCSHNSWNEQTVVPLKSFQMYLCPHPAYIHTQNLVLVLLVRCALQMVLGEGRISDT